MSKKVLKVLFGPGPKKIARDILRPSKPELFASFVINVVTDVVLSFEN